MSRPYNTFRYSDEEQAQLKIVREGLLETYKNRGLAKLSKKTGLNRNTVQRIWCYGLMPQRKTLKALYEALR